MQLQLKNIGMIKEANVKIDGLTVIAGENDTGKSTVGKALYLKLKFLNQWITRIREKKNMVESLSLPNLLFANQIARDGCDGFIKLYIDDKSYDFPISKDNNITIGENYNNASNIENMSFLPIMVETPIVWNLNKFFLQLSLIHSRLSSYGDDITIESPYLLNDINFKLFTKNKINSHNIKNNIIDIINGEFKQDSLGNFFFEREGKRIELINTATGIKAFGILQVLSDNNYLNKDTILILDEPEVHLHPKWQLEMAKIIVELVKSGVKIIVNSHSPYMIEALKRYSEVKEIEYKTNFYLAEDGYIEYQENLENIFEKLALPMRELKKLKMDKYLND